MIHSFTYENGRLNLWSNIEKSNDISSKEIEELGEINTITVPFFYWAAHHRDHVPPYASVFYYGTYPCNGEYEGKPSDLNGRLEISILPEDGVGNWEKVRSALKRVKTSIASHEGHYGLVFNTVVPFSTWHLKDTIKSLFPFTGLGCEFASQNPTAGVVIRSLIRLMMLIADLATIAFRLMTLPFRAIYQHCLPKNHSINGIQFSADSPQFEFGKGTAMIHTYNQLYDKFGNGKDEHLRALINRSATYYLG